MSPLAIAKDLAFTYPKGEFQLNIREFSMAPQQHTVIVGPSGCGKTTFAHLVAGILSPQQGKLQVDGIELPGLDDAQRRAYRLKHIGLVFQQFELLDYLTALENILLPFHLAEHKPSRADLQRAEELAEQMGVSSTLTRRPEFLSQGERQRIAICRALIRKPRLVICDEPTGNLDPDSTAKAMELLFNQVQTANATLLMVTHDHGLLGRFSQTLDLSEAS